MATNNALTRTDFQPLGITYNSLGTWLLSVNPDKISNLGKHSCLDGLPHPVILDK